MTLPYDPGAATGSIPDTSDGYPYGAVTYTSAGGLGSIVTLTNGLPVQPQTGATWPVSWTGQSVSVSNFPATQAVSWTGQSVGVSSLPSLPAGANSIGTVAPTYSSTGTVTSKTAVTSSATLLAANTSRKGYSLENNSTATLYLLNASGTASSTNRTLAIAPGGYYECPFNYQGVVEGVWSSVNGNANITEYT